MFGDNKIESLESLVTCLRRWRIRDLDKDLIDFKFCFFLLHPGCLRDIFTCTTILFSKRTPWVLFLCSSSFFFFFFLHGMQDDSSLVSRSSLRRSIYLLEGMDDVEFLLLLFAFCVCSLICQTS